MTCSSRPSAAFSEDSGPSAESRRRRVGRLDLGDLRAELLEEGLVQLVGDDEALGRVAGLAAVVEAGVDRVLHGGVEVVGREQDEGVRAAELEHDLLQVAAGDLGDRGAGALGAGERDALHARVRDDLLDLVVRGVDVHVGAGREARVEEDLLHRGGGLGALLGVLEQDRVADDEVRAGEAGDLVVREVPRHDAEQHPERRAADDRRAIAREELDRLVLQEVRRVVGVVLVDRRGEVDLAERLRDRLAHLAHDELRQLLAALGVQLADAADEGRALLDRGRLRPGAVRLVGCGDRGLELGVGDGVVGLDRLARGGVGHGIAHRVGLLVSAPRQSRSAAVQSLVRQERYTTDPLILVPGRPGLRERPV